MQNLFFILWLAAALTFFAFSAKRLITGLKIGKPDDRFKDVGKRIINMLKIALGQSKIMRDPVAGVLHVIVFWGFLVLGVGLVEEIFKGLLNGVVDFSFSFLGPVYSLITLSQDVFAALIFLAVIALIIRRWIIRPHRLWTEEMKIGSQIDATFILLMIGGVVTTYFLMYGYSTSEFKTWEVRPISLMISGLTGASENGKLINWWAHMIIVFTFLNFLPYSKHLHVLTSTFNVYFSRLEPSGRLHSLAIMETMAKMEENSEMEMPSFGAKDVNDLTWKQLFDSYSCTECGRCTDVCPANLTGKPLSPRKIIVDTRHRLQERLSVETGQISAESDEGKGILQKMLIGDYISEEELWSCTTCQACMQECPVMIEHVPEIIDMRRHLVMNESKVSPELKKMFDNLENKGIPWAFNPQDRENWTEGLDVPRIQQKKEVDILFWVGCAGAFDDRYKKVTRALATILNEAKVDYAIMGKMEKCTGDPARRAGNELIAETLAIENVANLGQYKFNKVVASCPHCFNTLKNEYSDYGGHYDVIHHTEYINSLIAEGKIKLNAADEKEKVTYHDSCYLGRANGIYDAPREILNYINGLESVEMNRSKDRGLCCGAGGARMFMEEKIGKRINVERAEEAVGTGASTVATACPFCMTMMNDGVKEVGNGETKVLDIAEFVEKSMMKS